MARCVLAGRLSPGDGFFRSSLAGSPMPTQPTDTSIPSSAIPSEDADSRQPFIDVQGIEGSTLRATDAGLIVFPRGASSADHDGDRRWRYDQLREVSLDAYGSVGVIRATVGSTGGTLPPLPPPPQPINTAPPVAAGLPNLIASPQPARPSPGAWSGA